MKKFKEWLLIKEATASDEALMNYYRHIEVNPNLDDIRTLVNMILQRDQRDSDVIPKILNMLKNNTIKKLPASEMEIAQEEIESAENQVQGREIGPKWKDSNELEQDKTFELIFGGKDSDFHFAREVENYLRDMLNFDLDSLEENDPILKKAYDMIYDQHETGIYDVKGIAEKIIKFLKSQDIT